MQALPVPHIHRLGVRIFLTLLMISLGEVFLSVGLLATEAGRVLRDNISQRNLSIARQAARETGRIIQESLADLQAIAKILGPMPYSDFIRSAFLVNIGLEYRKFSWVRLVRADGTPITETRTVSVDVEDDREALATLRTRPTYVSAVHLSADDYTPTVLVAVPVRLNDGTAGAMLAQLRLREIWGLLDEIGSIGRSGAAYVIDSAGVLLGHSDLRVLLSPEKRREIVVPPHDLPADGAVLPVHKGDSAFLTAYAPVSDRGWFVAIEQPVAEAFLPAEILVRQSLLLVALAAMISAAAGIVFGRRISAPLATLVRGTRSIAAGELGSRLNVRRPDEIGVLARAFNDMAASLEQRSRELEASERKYRLTTEHATDLIFSLDADGRCTFVSGRIRDLTGASPEEVIGLPLSEILRSPAPTELRPPVGANRFALVVETTTPDGRRVPLEVDVMRSDTVNGTPVWYGVARDISERRQLEEQLYQAQKMEAVGRLAGGVAHDFNNLLTAILGYCEIAMLDTEDRQRLRHALEQIRTAGRRATSLTRQLLAFSRRQVLAPRPLDLNCLLTDMEEMLRRLIGEHIALLFRFAPGLNRINADPGQIEQVVMNLCVNARDAMPEGGQIEIETAEDHDCVRLSIRDTGTGMTPEVQKHLFEPFFTTKEPGKGTGLGLSTVYGIVRQSGGDITCTSAPGAGTTFVISFPRITDTSVESTHRTSGTPSGGHETILVVEDDVALRNLIESVLSGAGYTTFAFGSAEEAQSLARRRPTVHLLITDLVLPDTSGRRLAEELRRLIPSLSVLMVSGYTADALDDYEGLANSTAFMQKPFLPSDLLARVRSLLDDGPNTRTPRSSSS